MTEIKEKSFINTYGSDSLDNLIERLQSTSDPKRRYEYILWLAKSLPLLTEDLHYPLRRQRQMCIRDSKWDVPFNGWISEKGLHQIEATK